MLIIVHHLILITKNDFLILGDGPTFGINGSFGASEKTIGINFSKETAKFSLTLH